MSSEWKSLLRGAAGDPPQHLDVRRLSERSRKLKLRRSAGLLLSSGLLLIGIGFVVSRADDVGSWLQERDGQGQEREAPLVGSLSTSPSPSRSSVDGQCSFAPVRPEYLPWLDPGVSAPEPKEERSRDLAALYWDNIASDAPYYVGLERTTAVSYADPGKPVPVEINGVQGQLSRDASASFHIRWELPEEQCNYIALVLVLPEDTPLTPEEAEAELVKVAESMQPADLSDD